MICMKLVLHTNKSMLVGKHMVFLSNTYLDTPESYQVMQKTSNSKLSELQVSSCGSLSIDESCSDESTDKVSRSCADGYKQPS